jgi:hypothetical protein
MSPTGFEPTIPASERPNTHALDSAATGIGRVKILPVPKNTHMRALTFYSCLLQGGREFGLHEMEEKLQT